MYNMQVFTLATEYFSHDLLGLPWAISDRPVSRGVQVVLPKPPLRCSIHINLYSTYVGHTHATPMPHPFRLNFAQKEPPLCMSKAGYRPEWAASCIDSATNKHATNKIWSTIKCYHTTLNGAIGVNTNSWVFITPFRVSRNTLCFPFMP